MKKISNTLNPFAFGDQEELKKIMVDLLNQNSWENLDKSSLENKIKKEKLKKNVDNF